MSHAISPLRLRDLDLRRSAPSVPATHAAKRSVVAWSSALAVGVILMPLLLPSAFADETTPAEPRGEASGASAAPRRPAGSDIRRIRTTPGALRGGSIVDAKRGAAERPPRNRRAPTIGDTLRESTASRRVQIHFAHSAWNLSPDIVRGIEIGVAIPTDDAHQKIHSVEFDPKPERVIENRWRQKTALFVLDELAPNAKVEIRSTIRATLRSTEWQITEDDVGSFEEIPESIQRQYLRNATAYGLTEDIVESSARAVRVSEGGPLEQVRRIHDFVTDQLEYVRDDRWDSADAVLRRGTGSCSEYTYVMIALCRLNGIPARYAGGTWLGEDVSPPPHADRVFHRWVEVYLPRVGWFPIDPTQGDRNIAGGDFYRHFGRIPWSYLTLLRGDGDRADSGVLGWDYRSGMTWSSPQKLTRGSVFIDRVAIWLDDFNDATRDASSRATTARRTTKAKSRRG